MSGPAKVLQISPDFALPLDAAARRLAILAMSGAGKSNVAVVLAEAMYDAGIPWVALDPKGDWWGVRSNKTGKGPGLPIPIFGGLHGDMPLEPTAGRMIGELVVDRRLTCVLDVSEFETRQDMWKFLADFGETLLRRNRQVLHVFLEECDDYIPQKVDEKGNALRCLGVWQRTIKKGRFRGIGTTQISQRSALVNKNTLYMADAMIAMRAIGKADRNAIKGWVEHNHGAEEIVSSLPGLDDGEAWISSPAWLKETKRIRFNRRRTFDSGATPVLAEGLLPPATLADVDIAELTVRMAATIEKVKSEDPAELRKQLVEKDRRIRQLSADSVKLQAAPPPAPPQIIKVPVLELGQLERMHSLETHITSAVGTLGEYIEGLKAVQQAISVAIQEAARARLTEVPTHNNGITTPMVSRVAHPPRAQQSGNPAPERTFVQTAPPTATSATTVRELAKSDHAILDALLFLQTAMIRQPRRAMVGLVARQSHTSSTFERRCATLQKAGLISYPAEGGRLELTATGRAIAHPHMGVSVESLQEELLARMPASRAALLRAAIAAYPEGLDRATLGRNAGQSHTSSTFERHLSALSTAELIEYPRKGWVAARPELFLEERP